MPVNIIKSKKNLESNRFTQNSNCHKKIKNLGSSNRIYLQEIKDIMNKNDNFLSEKLKPSMKSLLLTRKRKINNNEKDYNNINSHFLYEPLFEYNKRKFKNKININFKNKEKVKVAKGYKLIYANGKNDSISKKSLNDEKSKHFLNEITVNKMKELKTKESKNTTLSIINNKSFIGKSKCSLNTINNITPFSNELSFQSDKISIYDSQLSKSSDESSFMTEDKFNSALTLKKLVSIFSVKNNIAIHNLKNQVIDILDPQNKLSDTQRYKSLTNLLNDPNISILSDSVSSNIDSSTGFVSETLFANENIATQLAIEYTNLMISKTKFAKYRTSSSSNIMFPCLKPNFKSSYGCVDGINEYCDHQSFGLTKLKNDRESFNALSHMFTLKKLLGFDAGHKHGRSIRPVYTLSSDDDDISSDENEDSVDIDLMQIFSQTIKEIVNQKLTKRVSKRRCHSNFVK